MAKGPGTPSCKCHDEPMYRNLPREDSWRCAVKTRERNNRYNAADPEKVNIRNRRRYHSMTGVEYNHRLLQMRRAHATKRMRQREVQGG